MTSCRSHPAAQSSPLGSRRQQFGTQPSELIQASIDVGASAALAWSPGRKALQQLIRLQRRGGSRTGEHESNRPCSARRWPTMSGMGDAGSITIALMRRLQGPLVDVRSPSEFAKGHWPGAINLPLFSDQERAAVGTCYKQQGRRPAVHLGLRFTGPKLRISPNSWRSCDLGEPRIYCWRGGTRSASVAWLAGRSS